MNDETIKAPSGEMLRKIAQRKTTVSTDTVPKVINTDSTTIEVVISAGKILSKTSQFGHAAIIIDGIAYSMGPEGYSAIFSGAEYILKQQRFRDSAGFTLRLGREEKLTIKRELQRRVSANKPYNMIDNSCSSNVAEVLGYGNIVAYDPRYLPGLVTPGDLFIALGRSKRLAKKTVYEKLN